MKCEEFMNKADLFVHGCRDDEEMIQHYRACNGCATKVIAERCFDVCAPFSAVKLALDVLNPDAKGSSCNVFDSENRKKADHFAQNIMLGVTGKYLLGLDIAMLKTHYSECNGCFADMLVKLRCYINHEGMLASLVENTLYSCTSPKSNPESKIGPVPYDHGVNDCVEPGAFAKIGHLLRIRRRFT